MRRIGEKATVTAAQLYRGAVLAVLVMCLWVPLGRAEDAAPLLVTYGPQAATAEGDHDHRQVIYISVPLARAAPVYVRLFDPNTAGAHDTPIGAWRDSTTRFALYGGDGAFHEPAGRDDPIHQGGTLIAARDFGPEAASDDTWILLAEIMPDQGQTLHDRAVFRLEVEGVRGDDGNVYDVFASAASERNLMASDVETFAYLPTVRVPDDDRMIEIRLVVPAPARALTAYSFDASDAEIAFTTPFRTVAVAPSGQNSWASGAIALEPADIGRVAALTVRGGGEIPNDVTVYVATDTGSLVPLELPPRRWARNTRPTARLVVTPQECTVVAFSVVDTQDADADRLTTLWYFHDDVILSGDTVFYGFAEPGLYEARVEVLDRSGMVANGWAQDFVVAVKAPPLAVAQAPPIVALGEPVRLDATGSHSQGQAIARHVWTFDDGRVRTGPFLNHAFSTPGLHRVGLRVEDDAAHPCNSDETELTLRVNARPLADAGPDRHAAVGEPVAFGLGASHDADGEIAAAHWIFGDGAAGEAASAEHSYAAPGEYQVALRVDDGAGVSNSVGLDVARVRVNAPPVAAAGGPGSAVVGESVTFDGTGSHDPDGSIIDHLWEFGDGTAKTGAVVTHAYRSTGSFAVTLTVTDISGRANASAFDELQVTVLEDRNAAPVADAGEAVSAAVGEVVTFDASASVDPDGNIIAYAWDFGDGATAAGVTARYAFLRTGAHTVRLTVRDDSGKPNDTNEDTLAVRVHVPRNENPLAAAGGDLVAEVGEVVRFDGSASHDPDGNVISYDWDFGNGMHGSGIAPMHAFFEAGEYRVTLRVQDDSLFQAYDTDTLVVKVLPRADGGSGQ
jgi:PKD repeat protein